MMWLKSCPRCKTGDMNLNEDNYRLCLQCGHVQYSAAQPGIAAVAAKEFHIDFADSWPTVSERAGHETAVAV